MRPLPIVVLLVVACAPALTGCTGGRSVPAPGVVPPACGGLSEASLSQVLGSDVELTSEGSAGSWVCVSSPVGVLVRADTTPFDDVVASEWERASSDEDEPRSVTLPGAHEAVEFDQRDGAATHLVTVAAAQGVTWTVSVSAPTREDEARLAGAVWALARGGTTEVRGTGPARTVCRRLDADRVRAAVGRPVRADPVSGELCFYKEPDGAEPVIATAYGATRVDGFAEALVEGQGGEAVELPGGRAYLVTQADQGTRLLLADDHGVLEVRVATGDPAEDERVARALAAG